MAQLIDQYGRPLKKEALSESQTVHLEWINSDIADHPSRGLTPARLFTIFQSAEQGDLTAQSDLFQDMEEKDPHIHAEMSKRKRALLTLDWSIAAPTGASAKEKRDADELEEWLRDIDDLEDVMLDASDAIGHAFSGQAMKWAFNQKVWLPESFEHYPQRNFMTPPGKGNDLRLRNTTMDGEELWAFGWIMHTHKAKTGYVGRSGLFRVLALSYLFKNLSVRDLAEFLHIYGIPIRLGKYPAGSGKEEQATLLRAVAELGRRAGGIMPMGMELEIKEAANGQHDPFMAMIEWAERSQSKAILGGTLTTQADGKSSTNALGNVHNEVRHDLMVADARQLSSTLTRDLVYPIRALNQANVDPRRRFRFVFDTRELEDIETMSTALPALVKVGMRISEPWARGKLGIPEPEKGEAVLVYQGEKPPANNNSMEQLTAVLTQVIVKGMGTRRAALATEIDPANFPDQVALDAAADDVPAELQDEIEKLVAPVIEFLRDGGEAGDALSQLAEQFPDLDSKGLEQLLARAIFVADMWGRISEPTDAD